jgi:hypothetical protein
MVRITDDPSAPVSPRSTSQQVLPLHQHNMKQVSVEEMFKVRHSGFQNWLENCLQEYDAFPYILLFISSLLEILTLCKH